MYVQQMNSIYMLIFLVCIYQAPAVDVVGIGLQSGKIILHNLKFDETVMSFHQEWGPVIGLTFRTGMRLVRPFSQLFLFPIAFPLVIVGDKWLKKWKIGIFNKKREKKEELKEGVWVYEKLLYVLVLYFFCTQLMTWCTGYKGDCSTNDS